MSAITIRPSRHLRTARMRTPVSERSAGSAGPERHWTAIVIRLAVAADVVPLRRLAALDSTRPLTGEKLLAEQDGEILAAVSLADGAAIADPFKQTADALSLLRLRARQLDMAWAG